MLGPDAFLIRSETIVYDAIEEMRKFSDFVISIRHLLNQRHRPTSPPPYLEQRKDVLIRRLGYRRPRGPPVYFLIGLSLSINVFFQVLCDNYYVVVNDTVTSA